MGSRDIYERGDNAETLEITSIHSRTGDTGQIKLQSSRIQLPRILRTEVREEPLQSRNVREYAFAVPAVAEIAAESVRRPS